MPAAAAAPAIPAPIMPAPSTPIFAKAESARPRRFAAAIPTARVRIIPRATCPVEISVNRRASIRRPVSIPTCIPS